MIDFARCTVERLRADDTFILYRAHQTGGARSIIKAHGGALWASPNHPCGSVFRFTLPAATSVPRQPASGIGFALSPSGGGDVAV